MLDYLFIYYLMRYIVNFICISGLHWTPSHTRPMHYPWHKSPYLEQRKKQLKKFEEELDPHKPVSNDVNILVHAITFGLKSVRLTKILSQI